MLMVIHGWRGRKGVRLLPSRERVGAMRAGNRNNGVAVGVRCSVYYSCACAAAMLFVRLNPRSAFGLSDDQFGLVLIAASDSAQILSLLNAVLAIGMMSRFPQARGTPWLWAAIASPLFVMLLSPAIQSA